MSSPSQEATSFQTKHSRPFAADTAGGWRLSIGVSKRCGWDGEGKTRRPDWRAGRVGGRLARNGKWSELRPDEPVFSVQEPRASCNKKDFVFVILKSLEVCS